MSESPNRPRIGDYRSTPGNKPRTEAPKVPAAGEPTTTDTPIPAAAATPPPADGAAPQEPKKQTPAELYEARLKEAGITKKEANAIYDAVAMKGFYEEYVQIGSKLKALFRTRVHDDQLRLLTALEASRPNLQMTQDSMVTQYNMAASLMEWNGKALPHKTDDDFDEVLKVIKNLPAPIFTQLAMKLALFDQKLFIVFSDGAAESF